MLPGMQFSRIAATLDHLCGIIASGETVCWGRNLSGQLGDGTLVSHFDSLAVTVADGHQFTNVEVGGSFFGIGAAHSCGLASDGRTYCWGANFSGQIGRPVGARSTRPVTLVGQP
jgi:alpha-tubulin suppressor-like RCC1 family protein